MLAAGFVVPSALSSGDRSWRISPWGDQSDVHAKIATVLAARTLTPRSSSVAELTERQTTSVTTELQYIPHTFKRSRPSVSRNFTRLSKAGEDEEDDGEERRATSARAQGEGREGGVHIGRATRTRRGWLARAAAATCGPPQSKQRDGATKQRQRDREPATATETEPTHISVRFAGRDAEAPAAELGRRDGTRLASPRFVVCCARRGVSPPL